MAFLRQAGLSLIILMLVVANGYAEPALRYAGATTLQRFFMPGVAKAFTDATAIKVMIEGGNTTPGISALLHNEADMAGAGRLLTPEEKSKGLVEHFLGWDTLAIIVHEQNPLDSLSMAQLQAIFSGEITDWQDVGGQPGPIVLVTCPEGSGMRDAVKDLILKEKDFPKREIISAIVAEADQQVSLFSNSITALSKSMLDAECVKAFRVDGFEPTAENIKSGDYPLAKPLALVTKGEPQGDLARFFDLVKSPQGKSLLMERFVPAQ